MVSECRGHHCGSEQDELTSYSSLSDARHSCGMSSAANASCNDKVCCTDGILVVLTGVKDGKAFGCGCQEDSDGGEESATANSVSSVGASRVRGGRCALGCRRTVSWSVRSCRSIQVHAMWRSPTLRHDCVGVHPPRLASEQQAHTEAAAAVISSHADSDSGTTEGRETTLVSRRMWGATHAGDQLTSATRTSERDQVRSGRTVLGYQLPSFHRTDVGDASEPWR